MYLHIHWLYHRCGPFLCTISSYSNDIGVQPYYTWVYTLLHSQGYSLAGQYNFSLFAPLPFPFPLLHWLAFSSQATKTHEKAVYVPHDTFHAKRIGTPL